MAMARDARAVGYAHAHSHGKVEASKANRELLVSTAVDATLNVSRLPLRIILDDIDTSARTPGRSTAVSALRGPAHL